MGERVRGQARYFWSDVEESAINLEKLRLLCSHQMALRKQGYVTTPLDSTALLSKLRCKNCGARMKLSDRNKKRREYCEFHPGRVANLHFTCCQAHVSIQKGCEINFQHVAPDNHMQVLRNNWTYHITRTIPLRVDPNLNGHRGRRGHHANLTMRSPRKAIAVDCEFGTSILNEPELIRIAAVDFFTKQVLMDHLVKPSVRIKNYVTKITGITSKDIQDAVRDKTCIFGRDAARERLLNFVDSETVLVMHGGSSDMSSLRLIHPHIVDTHILETYFDSVPGGRSLKNLCKNKFGIEIQNGKGGHDSLEDALACRELAVWMMNLIVDV